MTSSASSARITGVHKRFGPVEALVGIDWLMQAGICSGLVGSSGSGKTTLLRIVAGLDEPDAGSVQFAAEARRPNIGMVFQNLELWPHLTARGHLECVLDMARSERPRAAESLLSEVPLPPSAWDGP